MKQLVLKPTGWKCKLSECKPGFFVYKCEVGFLTEYRKKNEDGSHSTEAYCYTGETFYAGDTVMVQPVDAVWEEKS